MTKYKFLFSDKQKAEQHLPRPVQHPPFKYEPYSTYSNSYDEDYAVWSSYIIPAMEKQRHFLLLQG